MSARKSTPPVARISAATPAVKSANAGKQATQESVLESLDKVLAVMELPTLLAQCDQLRQSGQQAAVIPLYQRWLSVTQSPARHVVWFNLGVELSNLGDASGAEKAYLQALALKPDLTEAQFNLGNSLEALGRPYESIELWREVLGQLDAQPVLQVPMVVMLLNNLGRLLEILKQYFDAEKYLERS